MVLVFVQVICLICFAFHHRCFFVSISFYIAFSVLGLGSWARVLGLGSWGLGLGSWVLGLGSWVLGLGSWVLDLGCQSYLAKHGGTQHKQVQLGTVDRRLDKMEKENCDQRDEGGELLFHPLRSLDYYWLINIY